MSVGKMSLLYQHFGHLYPGCEELQKSLCEYYAVVVRRCIRIIEVSHRTTYGRVISSVFCSFETEFKGFQSSLEQAARLVQLQISYASKLAAKEAAKLAELENRENADHRRRTLIMHKNIKAEHSEAQKWRHHNRERKIAKMRSIVLANLSKTDHIKPWKQAIKNRAPRTAEWFEHEPDFLTWKNKSGSKMLSCTGTMGTGKTVLVSNIIAHLYNTQDSPYVICYFFCRSDDETTLQARNILGSLARQILDISINHATQDDLENLVAETRSLDAEDVIDFVAPHLQPNKRYFVIVDGVEECDVTQIRTLARETRKLWPWQTQSDLKIFCACRPETEPELFRTCAPDFRISLGRSKMQPDINRYIDFTLSRCLEEGELKIEIKLLSLKSQKN